MTTGFQTFPAESLTPVLCVVAGLERDKFDNKTVSFEEHIKLEHNIWNYLYFIVLVREKNKTDYTGPESYVAYMIKVKHLHTPTYNNTGNTKEHTRLNMETSSSSASEQQPGLVSTDAGDVSGGN